MRVGKTRISHFLERLARSRAAYVDLEPAYREMAADAAREAKAEEWIEHLVGDVPDETR